MIFKVFKMIFNHAESFLEKVYFTHAIKDLQIVTENYFCVCHSVRHKNRQKNVTNILNCYFSKQTYPLAQQTKHLHALN